MSLLRALVGLAVAVVEGAGPASYLGVADPRRPGQAAGF